jgi:hypothetical protein
MVPVGAVVGQAGAETGDHVRRLDKVLDDLAKPRGQEDGRKE